MLKIARGWWKLPRPADLMAALRRTAAEATDPLAATLLRMLADDYWELAEKEAVAMGQQQQQIQPKKPQEQ